MNYPIYDPPHKVEERRLPKEQALQNFQYFMDVRQRRVKDFHDWLATSFSVRASLDQGGIKNMLDWAESYAAILLPLKFQRYNELFYGYSEAWDGEFRSINALFDLGTALGEYIIQERPCLSWSMEWSLSNYPGIEERASGETLLTLKSRERDFRAIAREPFGGFRRPLIASLSDASVLLEPIHLVFNYSRLVMKQTITIEHFLDQISTPRRGRLEDREMLKNFVTRALEGGRG